MSSACQCQYWRCIWSCDDADGRVYANHAAPQSSTVGHSHPPTVTPTLTNDSAKMAASIVGSDFLSKAGTMYIGERMWNKVDR